MLNFEMFDEAVEWRNRHRKQLRLGNRDQRQIARDLKGCRKSARCATEACPVCVRAFRLQWAGEGIKILLPPPHWTRCSIIPAGFLVPYGKLHTVDLTKMVKLVQKRLQRSGISNRIVIGGLDVSLNLNENTIIGWQLHLYVLIEGKNDKALRKAVKAAFPPEPTAAKPYTFREVENPLKAISYAYKGHFKRRSSYIDKQGHANTKPFKLKGPDQCELLQFLAQYKVGSRAILRGVRRNTSGKSFVLAKAK
jgi:hypothetical protein